MGGPHPGSHCIVSKEDPEGPKWQWYKHKEVVHWCSGGNKKRGDFCVLKNTKHCG